jgi:hypothetical protein
VTGIGSTLDRSSWRDSPVATSVTSKPTRSTHRRAEALLQRHADHRFEVFSAGLQPTEVHPLTRQVLTEVGIDPSELRAKALAGTARAVGRVHLQPALGLRTASAALRDIEARICAWVRESAPP